MPVHVDAATDHRVRGRPGQKKGDTRTQADAHERRRRSKSPLVRADERTAQAPSGALPWAQLDRNRRTAVGDDPNRRVAPGRDDPETSDERSEPGRGLMESDVRTSDEGTADAHAGGGRR